MDLSLLSAILDANGEYYSVLFPASSFSTNHDLAPGSQCRVRPRTNPTDNATATPPLRGGPSIVSCVTRGLENKNHIYIFSLLCSNLQLLFLGCIHLFLSYPSEYTYLGFASYLLYSSYTYTLVTQVHDTEVYTLEKSKHDDRHYHHRLDHQRRAVSHVSGQDGLRCHERCWRLLFCVLYPADGLGVQRPRHGESNFSLFTPVWLLYSSSR